jgi:YlmC/YmxH family sporulation protein
MGELRQKEVINVRDGGRLGFVCDVEIDTHTAQVTALVVYGRSRLFGLLGREPDTVIPWRDIEMIGGDIVLVKCDAPPQSESLFMKLWKKLTG